MPNRRILSLWFPRLAAERLLRLDRGRHDAPLAVVADRGNVPVLVSLSAAAEAEGLRRGQPVRDAQAMCPHLLTRLANPEAEAAFLTSLRRWAGKFSPWVAEEAPDGLVVDLTGCAHLFGGEAAVAAQAAEDCADLGLAVQTGIADTVGGAWALARFAGRGAEAAHDGDAIDSESPATRSRAARRRPWQKAPVPEGDARPGRIAAPGRTWAAIGPLPVAALRLEPDVVAQLARLGLRRIDELAGQPRAGLARRFGTGLVRRLDQALGVEPEPVSPARPPDRFAVRLTFPEPIGLEADILAALDRLLPQLGARLERRGRGARRVRMQCFRADGGMQWAEVGLARPSADPDRLRPLLALKVPDIDAGFGIDALRLEAHVTEPVHAAVHKGGRTVTGEVVAAQGADTALDDLIGRLGARVGLEAITRLHPADSHIPEKGASVLAAAWSEPARDWPAPPVPRPLMLWRPEPVNAPDRAPSAGRVPLARRGTPHGAGHGPRADRARMVAGRAGMALGRAGLLARDDRGGRPAVALLRARGRDEFGLVRPGPLSLSQAAAGAVRQAPRPPTRARRTAPPRRRRERSRRRTLSEGAAVLPARGRLAERLAGTVAGLRGGRPAGRIASEGQQAGGVASCRWAPSLPAEGATLEGPRARSPASSTPIGSRPRPPPVSGSSKRVGRIRILSGSGASTSGRDAGGAAFAHEWAPALRPTTSRGSRRTGRVRVLSEGVPVLLAGDAGGASCGRRRRPVRLGGGRRKGRPLQVAGKGAGAGSRVRRGPALAGEDGRLSRRRAPHRRVRGWPAAPRRPRPRRCRGCPRRGGFARRRPRPPSRSAWSGRSDRRAARRNPCRSRG